MLWRIEQRGLLMSWKLAACIAGSILVSIVMIFGIVGAMAPTLGSGWGQTVLAAVACLVGMIAGQAVHRRFFASA